MYVHVGTVTTVPCAGSVGGTKRHVPAAVAYLLGRQLQLQLETPYMVHERLHVPGSVDSSHPARNSLSLPRRRMSLPLVFGAGVCMVSLAALAWLPRLRSVFPAVASFCK